MSEQIRRALGRALAAELARLAIEVARELPAALQEMGTLRPPVKATPDSDEVAAYRAETRKRLGVL